MLSSNTFTLSITTHGSDLLDVDNLSLNWICIKFVHIATIMFECFANLNYVQFFP